MAMIWEWERAEVFTGHSLQHFSEIRRRLAARRIRHSCCVEDYNSNARTGSFGERTDYLVNYHVYVRRADYQNAQAAISSI